MVPFYNAHVDRKLLHSSKGFDKEDQEFYGVNRSFTSDEQVIFINPCDMSQSSVSSRANSGIQSPAGEVFGGNQVEQMNSDLKQ